MNKDITFKATVKNVPEYAQQDFKYIVATAVGGILWFWGATNDYGEALRLLGDSSCSRVILKNGNLVDFSEDM